MSKHSGLYLPESGGTWASMVKPGGTWRNMARQAKTRQNMAKHVFWNMVELCGKWRKKEEHVLWNMVEHGKVCASEIYTPEHGTYGT